MLDKHIVLQQNALTHLVKEESDRLDAQRKSIEIAEESQERIITLNEDSVKRHSEYLKIFALCVVELLFISILSLLGITSSIFMILSIITGSFVVIYASRMYISIISRDNIYFDELSSDAPIQASICSFSAIKIFYCCFHVFTLNISPMSLALNNGFP